MSFSSEVKEELSRHLGKSRHCQIAELAALIAFDGKVQVSESGCDLFLDSENELLNTKYDLLLKKLFDFPEGKSGREQKKIYETVKMWDGDHQIPIITATVCCFCRAVVKEPTSEGRSWPAVPSAIRISPTTLRLCAGLCHRQNSFGIP